MKIYFLKRFVVLAINIFASFECSASDNKKYEEVALTFVNAYFVTHDARTVLENSAPLSIPQCTKDDCEEKIAKEMAEFNDNYVKATNGIESISLANSRINAENDVAFVTLVLNNNNNYDKLSNLLLRLRLDTFNRVWKVQYNKFDLH